MERNVEVVKDLLGNKVVVIQDIRFKGKRAVRWSDVEKYLKQYVGEAHLIKSTNDLVYIGADLPDEYTHSNYTHISKSANLSCNDTPHRTCSEDTTGAVFPDVSHVRIRICRMSARFSCKIL